MTGGRVARFALLAACALLAALAFATVAQAKRGLVTGFHDDEFQADDPAERAFWLDRTVGTGAGIVRLTVIWENFAPARPPDPTDPGSASYDFSSLDAGVRDLKARGIAAILNVVGGPAWAEAPGRPPGVRSWKPNVADLANFTQALAARYSGGFDPDGAGPEPPLPAVRALELWNEENLEPWWLPPETLGKKADVRVDHYRDMLNSSYRAIKAVNPQMLLVTGGTGPYGDPPGGPYPLDGGRVWPVEFWQKLLCVHPVKKKAKKSKKGKKGKAKQKFVRTKGCPAPTLFDVFAHHPIDNTGKGPLQSGPTKKDVSTPDLGRLVPVFRAAERVGTTLPGRHPLWVTEFWWDSNPPNPSGAPLGRQARWIEQSLYLFWKAGASVAINFQVRDSTARPDVHAGFQAGIFFSDGLPKPALTAFRFPFVTERINKKLVRAWGKAPAGGKVLIQRKAGGWKTIRKLGVPPGGVFATKLPLRGKQRLRAQVGGQQSLVWKQK